MNKTVRVESNDPEHPTTYLHVKAFVEADVGFETSSLSLGDILASEGSVRETYIDMGRDTVIEIAEITTSSPLITARLVDKPDSVVAGNRKKFEISLAPGLPTGLFSENVVVRFKDDVRPASKLYLYGIVVNDVEVTPLALSFVVDTVPREGDISRSIRVTNKRKNPPVSIIEVKDSAGLIKCSVIEREKGQEFDVVASLGKVDLTPGTVMTGTVVITTDHPGQPKISIPYRIERK